MDILKIIISFLLWMYCFLSFGYLVKVTFLKRYNVENISEWMIIGLFSYFILFQLVAFPMILLKMKLSTLSMVWGMIILAVLIVPFFMKDYRDKLRHIRIRFDIIFCLAVFLVVYQMIYAVTYQYIGWDTLSYIGRINAALETDTMFLYTGDEGTPYGYIDFKHALSAFYMNSAFFCQVFRLPGFFFQKYVGGGICVIFANLIVYIIVKKIFNGRIAAWSVIFLFFIRFFFYTVPSMDTFLLIRSYESKAWGANIILPLIFGICIMLWKDYKDMYNWRLLFLTAMASLPISMSAILTCPVLIVCMIIPLFIVKLDKVILKRMAICLIPNAFWCLLYLLYVLKFIRIPGVEV